MEAEITYMKKIIVNVNPWQTRVAILRLDELQNIYYTSSTSQALERTFFKGVVNKVLPGIQTAFVDIGQERAGFLHISEIDRELAIERMSGGADVEDLPRRSHGFHRPMDMSKILREGEHILVQVSKEPVYEKGAKLTTCFTLPGRFIVLLPNIPRIAISKKIDQREERMRLKDILLRNLPEGMGAIIRTTSDGRSEKEILVDVNYLVKTWNSILAGYQQAQPQEKIYEDIPLSLQMIRDHLDDDVDAVVVDDKATQVELYKFVKTMAPEYLQKVHYYTGALPIFEKYHVEKQIKQALSQKVDLPSGGSIIVEQTQAMTVIDVNTGKYIGKSNMEETILETNMEAAQEIVRQLRLRNIGGLIVIDFIDMAVVPNRQKLIQFFEKILKERDKFQSLVLKVSELGIVQMTRKRSGKTLLQTLEEQCKCCHGLGFTKTIQTQCYELFLQMHERLKKYKEKNVLLSVSNDVFDYIVTFEYKTILAFEKEYRCKVTLESHEDLSNDQFLMQ